MDIYISPYSVGKTSPYCPIPNLHTRVPWLARLWLLVPPTVRALAYDILRKRLFTITGLKMTPVWRILPGVALKASTGRPVFEAHALLLVSKFTRIPSPTLYDIVLRPEGDSEWGDMVYILMSEIHGQTLSELLDEDALTTDDKTHIALDIRRYLDELQHVPNPFATAICSSAGDPELWSVYLQDAYHKALPAFDGIEELNAYIQSSMHPKFWERLKHRLGPMFEQQYRVIFTHGDLNPSNIMVHEGRVSGLIDWEFAGWMPEYWDFVASILGGRYWDEPFRNIMVEAGLEEYRIAVDAYRSLADFLKMGILEEVPTS